MTSSTSLATTVAGAPHLERMSNKLRAPQAGERKEPDRQQRRRILVRRFGGA
jgi:hypothetical protein